MFVTELLELLLLPCVCTGPGGLRGGCYVISVYEGKAKVRLNFEFLAIVKSFNFTMQ